MINELKQMSLEMALACVLGLIGSYIAIGVFVLHMFGIVSLDDMGKMLLYSLTLVYLGCAFVPPIGR